MGQVTITLNNQPYKLACADEDEARLEELGQMLTDKVSDVVSAVGKVSDAKLILMASLILLDEVSEGAAPAAKSGNGVSPAALEKIAGRIEGLAERLTEA